MVSWDFEIQDNQVYYKAKENKEITTRYITCTWDIFDIICKTYISNMYIG
jgi:hypothetical protein